MKPKWKRVGTHGQPPKGALVRYPGGEVATFSYPQRLFDALWLTADEAATLLPAPDDIEPAPLPEPWQPMSELEDSHVRLVLIAYDSGALRAERRTRRITDRQHGRIAWAPLPEHPGGAS